MKSPALQVAQDRLNYWQAEMAVALENSNAERAKQCARFVEEYGRLIAEIVVALLADRD
jgi:hypothetical protein